MKQTYALLLVLLFISGSKVKAQPGDKPLFDPYFLETVDTVSKRGPYTITRNMLQDRKGNYWFATWQ